MPGASAPYLFSKFVEGYMQGAQQSQMQRLQKAQNLMQIAQMRAKEVDQADTAEGRASAWSDVTKHMDEAEKLLKGSDGLWSTITKVFGGGKKKKQELEDPHQIFGVGGGGGQPQAQPQPGQGGGLEPPPGADFSREEAAGMIRDESGAFGGKTISDIKQPPSGMPVINKDGVAIERPAPQVLGGTAGQAAPREVAPPPIASLQQAGAVTAPDQEWTKRWGAPLQTGAVIKDKATGKGMEMVRVAPGQTEFWVNGQRVNYGEYNEFRKERLKAQFQSEFRKDEFADKIAEQTKMWQAQYDAQIKAQNTAADAYVQWEKQNGREPDRDVELEIRWGIHHQNPVTEDIFTQDTDGNRWKVQRNIRTGEFYEFSKTPMPMTQTDMDIKSFQLDPANAIDGRQPTWAEASDIFYRDRAKDNRVRDSIREAQRTSAQLTIESKRAINELRSKKDKLGKADIQKALSILQPVAIRSATQPYTLPDGSYNMNGGKFDLATYRTILHTLMVGELGLEWSKIVQAFGGDPTVITEDLATQAIGYARGATGGVTTATSGSPVYQPPKPARSHP